MLTQDLTECVELFEESMIEGSFGGFHRKVTDTETRINAVYQINNQSVTHSIIKTNEKTQMCIKVDGKTVSNEYETPEEVVYTIARNTKSSIEQTQ